MKWDQIWDPVPLLLVENEFISEQVRRETLRHSYPYGHFAASFS